MTTPVVGKDLFLAIGGGYDRSGNQASLEKNTLLFQRLLSERGESCDIFFADGQDEAADLQVIDRQTVPLANRLMAEFFGSDDELGLFYRNHLIPNVRGSASPKNLQQWFDSHGKTMQPGDRLLIYVTAHGNPSSDRRRPHETSIALWDRESIKMTEFVAMLDQLPQDIDVIAVMVQCYTGGFARSIFTGGDPDKGLSPQRRIGFFATVHDRPAAGCTPEVDETNYVEYSTYFWAALSGTDRSGQPIERPDYDGDGKTSFAEAHAYTILSADTIDLPLRSSDEFLAVNSRFGRGESDLLTDEEPYEVVLEIADPIAKALLEGLSRQLDLDGPDRLSVARRETQRRGRRGSWRGRQGGNESGRLRRRIARDVEQRWPELANTLNPTAIDLLTHRSDEFIDAIVKHPDYGRYRQQVDQADKELTTEQRKVKYERLLQAADGVVLRENLRRLNDPTLAEQLESLLRAESQSL
ncbi:hypothetical protein FYK55_23660 [Roseiconus nitratireducens]|uniref:Caspase domain-containing protein n=1 Tax=Roseiconus nitratireducens TaxID=2605748 RepID=A0A5M6CWN2_9BACT|nr:hypothetical protein FYK55_23660 [Roseiconus nitratireducens]